MPSRLSLPLLLAGIALVSTAVALGQDPPKGDLFVSPDGNDAWTGKLPDPNADNSDGPLATIVFDKQTKVRYIALGVGFGLEQDDVDHAAALFAASSALSKSGSSTTSGTICAYLTVPSFPMTKIERASNRSSLISTP